MSERRRTIRHASFWSWGMSVEIMTSDGAGFARLSYAYEDKYWFLSDLYVDESVRRRGVARLVVEEARKVAGGAEIHYLLGGGRRVGKWLDEMGLLRDGVVKRGGGR